MGEKPLSACRDAEDVNGNGILEDTEDINGNGVLDFDDAGKNGFGASNGRHEANYDLIITTENILQPNYILMNRDVNDTALNAQADIDDLGDAFFTDETGHSLSRNAQVPDVQS